MLHDHTTKYIATLSDADLLEYVLAGTRMYEPEAVAFARAELDRRKLPPEQISALRPAVLGKLAMQDTLSPPELHQAQAILCHTCGRELPTRYAEYHQNIGALIIRFQETRSGHFCRDCSRNHFRKMTLVTLLLGWWGFISFFVTIAYLLANLVQFAGTFSLPPVPYDAAPPQLDDAALGRIAAHLPFITDRLHTGGPIADLARELAPLANITPGQAYLFIQTLIQHQQTPESRRAIYAR